MGLVTYATRAGGYWAMRWVPPRPWVERWLREVPGALIVAVVAPALAAGGWREAAAFAAAACVMKATRRELLALIAGVGALALLRAI